MRQRVSERHVGGVCLNLAAAQAVDHGDHVHVLVQLLLLLIHFVLQLRLLQLLPLAL